MSDIAALRRQIDLLAARVSQLERQLAAATPVIAAVRQARLWDFSPYELCPDATWVALDRDSAEELMRALAGADHWRPWQTTLERRGPR